MITIEELQIVVDAKVDGALKGLNKTDKATKTFKDNALSMAKTFAGPLVAGAIAIAAIDIGKKFSALAAAAEEIESKFNVVFGDTAANVQEWAFTYSDSVGRSKSDTIEFLASIGSLLKPLEFSKTAVDDLSKTVVLLANDLGSFNDMPTEAVISDIQSAMVGNFEVTKKYGVVLNAAIIKQEAMNQGLFDGKTELDAQTKAQIALQLFIKGTSDAQGDLLKTQDSFTNTTIRLESAQKDLGIALGGNINESMLPLLQVTAEITKGLADWINKNKDISDFLSDMASGADTAKRSNEELNNVIQAGVDAAERLEKGFGDQYTQDLIDAGNAANVLLSARQRSAALDKRYAGEQTVINKKNAEAAANELAAEEAKATAIKRLDALRIASLTTKEKELELIRDEINEVFKFKDVPEVMQLINELAARRTELRQEEILLIEGTLTAEDSLAIARQEEYDILVSRSERRAEISQEEQDNIKATQDRYKELADELASFVTGPLTDLGKALVLDGDSWEDLGRTAISVIASIVQGLGEQAVVQSAIAFASGNVPVGLAYGAAAAGAFVAAGAIAASAELFAAGGDFVTDGPRAIIVGDNPGGREHVSITPESSPNISGPQGGQQPIQIFIGNELIYDSITEGTKNGQIQIFSDSIV